MAGSKRQARPMTMDGTETPIPIEKGLLIAMYRVCPIIVFTDIRWNASCGTFPFIMQRLTARAMSGSIGCQL